MQTIGPRATVGNVQWPYGRPTASFITPTVNLKHAPVSTRLTPMRRWENLYAGLAGTTFRHYAIDRLVPVSAVMQKMAATVPGELSHYPAWERKMAETAEFLSDLEQQPTEKWTVLTVDLPLPKPSAGQVAWWQGRRAAGLPPQTPPEDEQHRARAEADKLLVSLRHDIPEIVPATPGELRWMAAYHLTFGGIEPPYTHAAYQAVPTDRPVLVAPLGNGELNPDRHRATYVSIDAPLIPDLGSPEAPGTQRVYQARIIVQDFAEQWRYPQAALWDDLDELDDVRITGTLVARGVSNLQARKKLPGLFKHTRWTTEESEGDATPDIDTAAAHESLLREQTALAAGTPEVPAAYVLTLASSEDTGGVDALEEAVKHVTAQLDPSLTRFARPRGLQTRLWQATLPGSAHGGELVRYERRVLPSGLAGLGLFHGREIGDPEGRLYALTATGGHPGLVFRNPMRGPSDEHGNTGATRGNVGDMGGGKSLDVKEDADQVIDTGGGNIAIDISLQREWWRASHAFSVETMVIDPADTNVTFDPLRTFTHNLPADAQRRMDMLRLAERHSIGFFAMRLSLMSLDDDRYDVLEGAVQDLLADDPPLAPSSPNLLRLLRYRAGDPDMPEAPKRVVGGEEIPDRRFAAETSPTILSATETIIKRLTNLGRSGDKGRSIMGTGHPLDLTAPSIVISDPGVDLNTLEGRSSMYLATAYTMAFLHATPRFNLACLTELNALTRDDNPWGQRLVDDVLTQSRRAWAGLAADSQLARHYKHVELLIERTAARTQDEQNAKAHAIFCGVEPSTDVVTRLQTLPTGMKLYRDRYTRTGFVDVIPPLNEQTFMLFRTDKDALALSPEEILRGELV